MFVLDQKLVMQGRLQHQVEGQQERQAVEVEDLRVALVAPRDDAPAQPHAGGREPVVAVVVVVQRQSDLRLLLHFMRLAASRTFWTAGSSSPIKTAMIAITTNSSISVNAWRARPPAVKRLRRRTKDDAHGTDPLRGVTELPGRALTGPMCDAPRASSTSIPMSLQKRRKLPVCRDLAIIPITG